MKMPNPFRRRDAGEPKPPRIKKVKPTPMQPNQARVDRVNSYIKRLDGHIAGRRSSGKYR